MNKYEEKKAEFTNVDVITITDTKNPPYSLLNDGSVILDISSAISMVGSANSPINLQIDEGVGTSALKIDSSIIGIMRNVKFGTEDGEILKYPLNARKRYVEEKNFDLDGDIIGKPTWVRRNQL